MQAPDLAAAIAARYGAVVAPGVTVQRIAPGVSSRPLPIWDPARNALVVPDWKEQEKARRAASVKRTRAASRKTKAQDKADLAKLVELHEAGASTTAIAQACGISEGYCRSLLARMGRKANPDPAHAVAAKARLGRMRAAWVARQSERRAERDALILSLVAQGRDIDAIARATGMKVGQHLRRMLSALAPDYAAAYSWPVKGKPVQRKAQSRAEAQAERIRALVAEGAGIERIAAELGMKPARHLRRVILKAAPGFGQGQDHRTNLDERDRMVARLYPDLSKPQMVERLGLTLGQITAAIKRARAAGLLPPADAVAPPKREKRRRSGLVYNGDRSARILDLHRQGLTIEAIMAETGLKRDPIKRVLWAAGESVRNERSTVAAARLAELPDLVARGLDGQAIADRWGVTLGTVYQVAHRACVSLTNRPVPHNRGVVAPKVAARRELVRALVLRGFRHVEMIEMLKISHATLSSDIKALGLSGKSPNSQANRKAARAAAADRRAA